MSKQNMELNWAQLAKKIEADYQGPALPFNGISHDTRILTPGQAYVAIIGHRTDGHHFIQEAVEKGACCVIVSQPVTVNVAQVAVLTVADTTKALGLLAKVWREQFSLPVVGITGSMGKTTTKECLGAILSVRDSTLVTAGNWNNLWGMPLTLLQLQCTHKAAVIEMGINVPGEMQQLASIAQPTMAIITKIDNVHAAGLGSEAEIALEKSILFEHLPASGMALAPFDCHLPLWQEKASHCKLITCGVDPSADVTVSITRSELSFTEFDYVSPWGKASFTLPLPGVHQVWNAMFAISAACLLGVTFDICQQGLSKLKPVAGRLNIISLANGATIIDDSYSANPTSVAAALEVLSAHPGRKVFVFGQMAELDAKTEVSAHKKVGKLARSKGVDELYGYGHLATYALSEYDKARSDVAGTHADLLQQVQLKTGDVCLIKGSNSNQLSKIVEALVARYNEPSISEEGKIA